MQDAREEGLEEGRARGMAEGLEKGMAKGMEKGIEEERKKNAKTMKAKGIDVNTIAEVTGMTVDDVLRL
jgi:predicted transposase/invertase (TIGR01784 family)